MENWFKHKSTGLYEIIKILSRLVTEREGERERERERQ